MFIQDCMIKEEINIKTNEHGFFTEFPQFGKFARDKEYRFVISEIPMAFSENCEDIEKQESDDTQNYWYRRYCQVHSVLRLLQLNGAKVDFKNITKDKR